ncbi:MAG: VOC family protein [Saprospiraceae bacterium]|nr:VOC family protein [Saprospiraceae bacterium]
MKNLKTCRVNMMVSNMDEAIDFYQNKLGLELTSRYGDHYAEIQAPDLLIGLHPTSEKIVKGNNLSIGFGVVEFDATIKELESNGIGFKMEQDGWIRLAYFTDLDDNQLFLAERTE